MTDERRFRRPALFEPGQVDSFSGDLDPARISEVAHESAAALVHAGRSEQDPELTARLVGLVDELGLSTLAELWSSRSPVSLPGALWRVYVLREWVRRDPAEVVADYRAGLPYVEVDRAIAGAAEPPDPEAMLNLGDAILTGVFEGDLSVALERAAAFCRIISVGRAHRADDSDGFADDEAERRTMSAAALRSTASDLHRCACLWREGKLH